MKYCEKCKKNVDDNATVCPDCGGALVNGVTVENTETPVFGEVVTAEDSAQTCETDNIETPGFDTEQDENELYICHNCGNALEDWQNFCTQCGTPREDVKLTCKKCGAELQAGQAFCMQCGQKTGIVANTAEQKRKITMTPKTAVIATVAVILLGITFLVSNVFMSVDRLCERGDYEKAYEKAFSDKKKLEVIAENATAVQSAIIVDNLIDPTSFTLVAGYWHEWTNDDGGISYTLALDVSGANRRGDIIRNYYAFRSDNKTKWDLVGSVADLEDDEYSEYDDVEELDEKRIDNLTRELVREAMKEGVQLQEDSIENINNMFRSGKLDEIKLLDVH